MDGRTLSFRKGCIGACNVDLLDCQDREQPLTPAEREEAQGLVDMAEWLSLLRL